MAGWSRRRGGARQARAAEEKGRSAGWAARQRRERKEEGERKRKEEKEKGKWEREKEKEGRERKKREREGDSRRIRSVRSATRSADHACVVGCVRGRVCARVKGEQGDGFGCRGRVFRGSGDRAKKFRAQRLIWRF